MWQSKVMTWYSLSGIGTFMLVLETCQENARKHLQLKKARRGKSQPKHTKLAAADDTLDLP